MKIRLSLVTLVLTSCASGPQEIPATPAEQGMYADLTCMELEDGLVAQIADALQTYEHYRSDVVLDIALNLLVFPFIGELTPNHLDEIGRIKGRVEEIDREAQRCDEFLGR